MPFCRCAFVQSRTGTMVASPATINLVTTLQPVPACVLVFSSPTSPSRIHSAVMPKQIDRSVHEAFPIWRQLRRLQALAQTGAPLPHRCCMGRPIKSYTRELDNWFWEASQTFFFFFYLFFLDRFCLVYS